MRLIAPAKINLHLRVGPVDASGYHPVMTWMSTVGLFDTLTVRSIELPASSVVMPAEYGDEAAPVGVALTCSDPRLPCDQTNLVHRAATALLQHGRQSPQNSYAGKGEHSIGGAGATGTAPAPIEIALEKRIPQGAGLGGGSSDAARTLLGLNRLWALGLPLERLHAIAQPLGSDVPFFLHAPSGACTGRGEIVRPVPAPRARWALLILPEFAAPTSDVYRRFDELRLADAAFAKQPQPDWQEWAELSAGPLLSRLRNDLEPAAFALLPQLGRLREALELSLARVIRMTGSGSSLFTLFDEPREAEIAAQFVRTRHMLEALAVELAPRVQDDLTQA